MSDNPERKNEETGRLAGFGAGVLTGAQLGTALMPGVGTFAGALVGGALGSKVGERVVPTILNAFDSLRQGAPTTAQPAQRSSSIPISSEPADADLLSQLERLGQLRSQGLLTESEFAAAKAQLLNR